MLRSYVVHSSLSETFAGKKKKNYFISIFICFLFLIIIYIYIYLFIYILLCKNRKGKARHSTPVVLKGAHIAMCFWAISIVAL